MEPCVVLQSTPATHSEEDMSIPKLLSILQKLQNCSSTRDKGVRKYLLLSLFVVLMICAHALLSPYFWKRELVKPKNVLPGMELYYVPYPHEYRFILDHPEKCSQLKPFMVVIVPVAPGHMEERNAIRRTWGNDSHVQDGRVLVLFMLGLPSGSDKEAQQELVRQENLQHQDLLQSDFIDSYRNLTIKTMVMLEWLRDRCAQATYAAKVDADVLLNIDSLLKMLQSPDTQNRNYITGLVWYGNVVIREPSNKFYIPPEVYPNSVYPPYPLGMCYIISLDLPEKILQVSKEIKPIFIEDAYIGLCIEQLHIVPTNPPNMDQFVVVPPGMYDRCYYSNLIAVMTRSPDQLITYWTDLHTPGPTC